MSQRSQDHAADEESGFLTNDGSARWIVSIDEASQGPGWVLEIDSPHAYLTVQVTDLSALARAIGLLKLALATETLEDNRSFVPNRDDVPLGEFGGTMVHLLRDNEGFPRCFILVQPSQECALRITVEGEDLRAFMRLLSQALADYPDIEKP
jgi:hypothetical protein